MTDHDKVAIIYACYDLKKRFSLNEVMETACLSYDCKKTEIGLYLMNLSHKGILQHDGFKPGGGGWVMYNFIGSAEVPIPDEIAITVYVDFDNFIGPFADDRVNVSDTIWEFHAAVEEDILRQYPGATVAMANGTENAIEVNGDDTHRFCNHIKKIVRAVWLRHDWYVYHLKR